MPEDARPPRPPSEDRYPAPPRCPPSASQPLERPPLSPSRTAHGGRRSWRCCPADAERWFPPALRSGAPRLSGEPAPPGDPWLARPLRPRWPEPADRPRPPLPPGPARSGRSPRGALERGGLEGMSTAYRPQALPATAPPRLRCRLNPPVPTREWSPARAGDHRDKSRRRPTLPGNLSPSTIGAGGLNCRVRNGNGCFPTAMVTGNYGRPGTLALSRQRISAL